MSRTVHLDLEVHMVVVMDEGVELQEVVCGLEHSFADTTGNADVLYTDITGHEVTDSR